MKTVKTQKITKEVVCETINICDVCKKEFSDSNINDIMEIQEFIHVRHHCGFASVFGDGMILELDMCQNCFKEKLGQNIICYRTTDN